MRHVVAENVTLNIGNSKIDSIALSEDTDGAKVNVAASSTVDEINALFDADSSSANSAIEGCAYLGFHNNELTV